MRCGICKKEGARTVAFTEGAPMVMCDDCATVNKSNLNSIKKEWVHDRYVDLAVILFGCLVAAGFVAAILIK